MNCGSWNLDCIDIMNEIVSQYGFDSNLAEYVISSIAFGLGYLDNVELLEKLYENKTTKQYDQSVAASKFKLGSAELSKKTDEYVQQYREEAEAYLDSIIEIKGDWEKDLGAKITASSLYEMYINNSNISLNIEIDGRITLKFDFHISFNYVLYNAKGKILYKSLGLLEKQDNNGFSVIDTDSTSEMYYKSIGNIAKIIVYWEKL